MGENGKSRSFSTCFFCQIFLIRLVFAFLRPFSPKSPLVPHNRNNNQELSEEEWHSFCRLQDGQESEHVHALQPGHVAEQQPDRSFRMTLKAISTRTATKNRIRISQRFIDRPSLQTESKPDQPHEKGHNPGNTALPQHHVESPFSAEFPFDGGDGCNGVTSVD